MEESGNERADLPLTPREEVVRAGDNVQLRRQLLSSALTAFRPAPAPSACHAPR